MRRMTTAAVIAVIAVTTGNAQAQTRPAPAPSTESGTMVRNTTLVVEDIDRTVDFYLRLGLVKVSDRSNTANEGGVYGANDLPLTADPTVSRTIVLRGANDRSSAITLLGYDRPKLASARGNLAALGTGDIMLVLEVPDIGEVYRRLSQIGTHFHRTPYRFSEGGEAGPIAGQRMLAFDPDGHLVEVIQIERK